MKKITVLVLLCLTFVFAQSGKPDNIKVNFAEFNSDRKLMYLVELPPDYDSTRLYPLIVGLHGYTGRPQHYQGTAASLCPEGAIGLYPQGVFVEDNFEERNLGYAWFHLRGSLEEHLEFVDNSISWIMQSIRTVIDDYPIDTSKIFLYGFSQGGIMSYTVGLAYPHMFRGVMPGGAVLDVKVDSLYPLEKAAYGLPIQAFHGVYDEVIVLEKGERAKATMDSLGVPAELLLYPVGHTVIDEMAHDARDFIFRELYVGEVPKLADILCPFEEMTPSEYLKTLDRILLAREPVAEIEDGLLKLYKQADSQKLKEKVIYLLGARRCTGAQDMLAGILDDKDMPQSMRQAAYSALLKLGTQEAWKVVEKVHRRVIVTDVDLESQAAELGIRPGDIIVSYNRIKVETERDLREAKSKIKPGQKKVRMVVITGGKKRKLRIEPGQIGLHLDDEIR